MKEKDTTTKGKKLSYEDVASPKAHPAWNIIATVGLLLIAAGTLIPILNGNATLYRDMAPTFKFIFAAGALVLLVARIFSSYKGKVLRLKRLHRIEIWSALFFCTAAFFLFYEADTTRNWLAFTLAGAAIQVYTSFMIPRTMRKAMDGTL